MYNHFKFALRTHNNSLKVNYYDYEQGKQISIKNYE